MDKGADGSKHPGPLGPCMPHPRFEVDVDLTHGCPEPGGVIVLAFPTVGQAGAVAANFLVRSFDLTPSGGVFGPGLGPLARIDGGRVVPMVRAFCKSLRCKAQGGCDGLTVLVSDLPVPVEHQFELADTLVDWVREIDAGLVVVLEGVNLPGAQEDYFGAATNDEGERLLRENDIPHLKSGALAGVGAAFLSQAARRDVTALSILAPAKARESNDPGAAAHLLKAIDRLLVDVKIDPGPLMEESERVQATRPRAEMLPIYS